MKVRNIPWRLRNPVLHTVHELYPGDLCQIIILPRSGNGKRHPLNRNLASQINHDISIFILLYIYSFIGK